jgi:hypothetical protein
LARCRQAGQQSSVRAGLKGVKPVTWSLLLYAMVIQINNTVISLPSDWNGPGKSDMPCHPCTHARMHMLPRWRCGCRESLTDDSTPPAPAPARGHRSSAAFRRRWGDEKTERERERDGKEAFKDIHTYFPLTCTVVPHRGLRFHDVHYEIRLTKQFVFAMNVMRFRIVQDHVRPMREERRR